MNTTVMITRHIGGGKIVGLVVKYNPPCPPIQVYRVNGKKLHRVLPDRTEIEQPFEDLTTILRKSKGYLERKNPLMTIEDTNRAFNPQDYITNPLGEYEIF